jgi:hypothetical protein
MLNHVVQYTRAPAACKRRLRVRLAAIAHRQMVGAFQRDLSALRRSGVSVFDLRSHRFAHRSHHEPLAPPPPDDPPLSLEPPLDEPESESDDPVATLQSHADDDSLRETIPLSGRRR